ncbi:UvrABC system protein C [Frankliniella fusca]|uniref:UvrABC system protein C n=1 Tax=Frankliniella fusca TaxID=407009 RepID=A0AAE1GTJ2_9NEOP|nr:UvrABC system protein C [Frankliniella fusca]
MAVVRFLYPPLVLVTVIAFFGTNTHSAPQPGILSGTLGIAQTIKEVFDKRSYHSDFEKCIKVATKYVSANKREELQRHSFRNLEDCILQNNAVLQQSISCYKPTLRSNVELFVKLAGSVISCVHNTVVKRLPECTYRKCTSIKITG